MIELHVRRSRQGVEMDLLPWADPYIMQLFLESEMLGESGATESAAGLSAGSGGHSAQAAVAAPLNDDSWGISLTRRPSLPRRRRIESERFRVRC